MSEHSDMCVMRREHEQVVRRLDEENDRQNHRIAVLEKNVQEISQLTSSVKELAVNMNHMVKEQEKQGAKLEALEGRDGQKWRSVTTYVLTTVIGVVVGFVAMYLGFK